MSATSKKPLPNGRLLAPHLPARSHKTRRPLGRSSRSVEHDADSAEHEAEATAVLEADAEAADKDDDEDDEEEDVAAAGVARNQNAASDDKASFLSLYFREMSALDVLQPKQEFTAAREIELLEIAIWQELFSYAPAVDLVLKVVEHRGGPSASSFRGLRTAANAARRSSSKVNVAKLERAAERAAEKLREDDTDRENLDAVLAELRAFVGDAANATGVRVVTERQTFSADSRHFRAYLDRVLAADRQAARARNAFVKANLRLVVSIARRFNHGRMSLADLIQEGNIGLMKAVERYDYRRGFRFSTYASWWIRHAISRALADKGREVRLPVHMIDAQHRLARAKRELTAKLGRQPTNDELAEATDIAPAKIEKMRSFLTDQSFSLDRPVNDEDGRTLGDMLQDPRSVEDEPAQRMTDAAMSREVHELLTELLPIEADILRQRFGLDDDVELTLKQIGQKYNLSRERIRQLQEQALTKMRRALSRKHLM